MTRTQTTHNDRIVSDPEILVGKPTVKGTRISVESVIAHLADNPDVNDVLAAYPRLTLEDVKACLDFASERVASPRRNL